MPKARQPLPTRKVADVGEFGLIDIIRKHVGKPGSRVALGIGDDAAGMVISHGKLLLATCDVQAENRHFRRQWTSARQLGQRAAAINLSDIAAMGGEPLFALVSLILPEDIELEWTDNLYEGLQGELRRFGAEVVGGNLSGTQDGIIVDITLLGEVAPEEMLKRSGAKPGDALLVTGSFGASAAGYLALERGLPTSEPDVAEVLKAHLTPTPRVAEGRAVAGTKKASAMIDVSDGLAADLGHICDESRVGTVIRAEQIPISMATQSVAKRLGMDAMSFALHGGEDFQLVVACPRAHIQEVVQAVQGATGTPLTEIGEIVEPGKGRTLIERDRKKTRLKPKGWDHFAREGSPTERGEGWRTV